MFTEYVDKAMHKAVYEIIEDDGLFYASIPGFEGVMATGKTLEECREDLKASLEDWLVLGLWLNDESLPKVGKLDLVPRKYVVATRAKGESASAP